jgi:hypothetical protein
MEKKKLTGEERERILLLYSLGVAVGGLVANCAEVFFIGWFFCFGGLGWSVFKEFLQTKRTPPNRPL